MKTARSFMLGVAATAAMAGSAMAADFDPYVPQTTNTYAPPANTFSFEGFYAGVLGGAFWDHDGGSSYLADDETWAGSLGAAAGVNFYLTDTVLGGFEVQGSANITDSGTTFDGLALGRVGFAPTSDTMVYGAGGVGIADGEHVYALGGGAEVAMTDNLGVRGEVLGIGDWGGGFDGAKATAGLMWHMN